MKVFIANRGEIARRIATTVKRLGYQTATVRDRAYTPAFLSDLIDEWFEIENLAVSHYLDASLMIQIAKDLHCDAVHPGFGFLSENGNFAESVISAGLLWIGPHPKAIRIMADKGKAIEAAQTANVPCIPGLKSFDLAKAGMKPVENFVSEHGLPILIKAAMGGGGKGMRVVRDMSELSTSCQRAESEAKKFFGDGRLIVEKYLEDIRHIEVQVLGDKHGQVAILGERDCSAQRRHQKIVEESPASGINEDMRLAMYAAAKNLAEKVAYDNAGTVEYAVAGDNFYFLEMNTRLQVEHPVTEEVFGVDLVEQQLRVAQNQKLGPMVLNAKPRGHSIEVRIYAEDIQANFLPAAGPVDAFVPFHAPGIRWEIGLDTIDEVTSGFDPMIAKVVSYGGDRKQAIARLQQTLSLTFLAMEKSNVEFLLTFLESAIFQSGVYTVNSVAAVAEKDFSKPSEPLLKDSELQAILASLEGRSVPSTDADMQNVIHRAFAKQLDSPTSETKNSSLRVISRQFMPSQHFQREVSFGKICWQHFLGWYALVEARGVKRYWFSSSGQNLLISKARDELAPLESNKKQGEAVFSPVPGKVLAVYVKPGMTVDLEQTMMVLESMKMEFEVKSVSSGIVAEVLVNVGQQAKAGELLVTYQSQKV